MGPRVRRAPVVPYPDVVAPVRQPEAEAGVPPVDHVPPGVAQQPRHQEDRRPPPARYPRQGEHVAVPGDDPVGLRGVAVVGDQLLLGAGRSVGRFSRGARGLTSVRPTSGRGSGVAAARRAAKRRQQRRDGILETGRATGRLDLYGADKRKGAR